MRLIIDISREIVGGIERFPHEIQVVMECTDVVRNAVRDKRFGSPITRELLPYVHEFQGASGCAEYFTYVVPFILPRELRTAKWRKTCKPTEEKMERKAKAYPARGVLCE